MDLLVKSGLTPLDPLQAATINAAEALGISDDLGTIEEGKIADLVLLDSNPLEDIQNTRQISAIMIDGKYYDRDALNGMLHKR